MRCSAIVLTAAILSGTAAGCDDTSESVAPVCRPALEPVTHDEFRLEVDDDGRLRDELGREVVLRGLNTGGRSKFEPFLPFEIEAGADLDDVRSAADAFYGRLLDWGLDTVRMPFSWEGVEPEPGVIDADYLDRYEAMIDAAWSHGLRVIVDFHQDVYASPFCGDGFPPWTVEDLATEPPHHDCEDWFQPYLFGGPVATAFDRFWSNESGVQDAFVEMWTLVAERFGDHPGVIAFEIINEPFAGSAPDADAWKREVLVPFYGALATEIHRIAPRQLILYDNQGTEAIAPAAALHIRPEGDLMVYAPHYYDWSIMLDGTWSGSDPEPEIAGLARIGAEDEVPVLIGEFGFADGVEDGPLWLTLVMDALDAHRVSATLWEYSMARELWNSENFSVVNADGSERAVLDAYVRPWLRAVAGTEPSFSWDAETGTARASWIAADGVTEVVVPRRLFPRGPQSITLAGAGACHTWDQDRGEIRVAAPGGTEVVLGFGE